MDFNVRLAASQDQSQLAHLIAGFRQALARLRGMQPKLDLDSASRELSGYQTRGFPIYVAQMDPVGLVAYLVCRVDQDVVWAESLYVDPAYRRQGIASALYTSAEKLAQELGSETLYNWVDPHNDPIIAFLRKRGYHVLNLIELRRARPGEQLQGKLQIGPNQFDTY
jgi:ribosomal protein S18 acetylase RimI-like enzyme